MTLYPTPEITYEMPARPKRKKLPKHHFLNRMGDKERAMQRLAWLQDRANIMPIAENQWRDLNIVHRAWLSFCGHTPISYYEAQR